MRIVCDIETNGLYRDVSKIHCIVAKDLDSGKLFIFADEYIHIPVANSKLDYTDGSISDGVRFVQDADEVIGHNWVDYDCRVLKKLRPQFIIDLDKYTDTLLLSHMLHPHKSRNPLCPPSKETAAGRRQIGPHSLENWGYDVGLGKIEYEEWDSYDYKMLERCVSDVEITHRVYTRLLNDMNGTDWSESIRLEKWFRFVISEQEAHGWYIDMPSVMKYSADLSNQLELLRNRASELIPLQPNNLGPIKDPIKIDGTPKKKLVDWYNQLDVRFFRLSDVVGSFTRVGFEPLNLESPKQRIDYLLRTGWVPTEYNVKTDNNGKPVYDRKGQTIPTTPKLTEDSVKGNEVGELMSHYLALSHKLKMLEGWKQRLRDDNCLEAGGVTCGTNTGRMRHRAVVNVPKVGEPYGEELRSIFAVRPGYRLVGTDLSALENRIIGHYVMPIPDGREYTRRLEEDDPHDHTVKLFNRIGLPISRNQAKAVNYSLSYGAQGAKLAEIVGCNLNDGKRARDVWWKDRQPVLTLTRMIEASLSKRGQLDARGKLQHNAYIKGLDGRKVFVRSKHSLLNSLIQNAGSVIHKHVTVEVYKGIQVLGLDAHFVGNFHDEIQCEVLEKDVDRYIQLVLDCIKESGNYFKLRVPMSGEAKIGNNWAQTH